MAEALGVVGSVVAVVELSASIAKLCVQYSTEVASARADIQRLHSQVEQLGAALQDAQRLIDSAKAQSLPTTRSLDSSFRNCIAELKRIEEKLGPSSARKVMYRLGYRALKWPFNSKEVAQILSGLERHEKTILLGLQIDQTNLLHDMHQGVKQLALQSTQDAAIPRKPHGMVPPLNPDFTHRPIIQQWIRDQYRQPDQRMALVGLGGFGKSQLANDFAHHVHAEMPGTSVFWVQGNSRATLEESYRALADVLSLPRRHEPSVNVLALVRDWLQREDISPWLMVLDNVDDVSVYLPDKGHDNTSQDPLASYLPKSINGKILITSRSLDAAEKLTGNSRTIRHIPVMGEAQALELFQNKLESKIEEATAATDLVLELGCIPLAVTQAAAYINRRSPRTTIASYLEEFRKSTKRKDSLLRSDRGDLHRQDGVSNSVVVTWQVTFEQIKRERPAAANLLSLMCQFQPQNIPENMLRDYDRVTSHNENDRKSTDTDSSSDEGSTAEEFEDDIDVLRGYSLVTLGPSGAGFCQMHPLVHFCTRSWISEFENPARWSQLFLKIAADNFPSGEFGTWEICQNLLTHVEPILSKRPSKQEELLDWAELIINISSYLVEIGEWERAEVFAEQATEIRTNILGPDHPSTLAGMTDRAGLLAIQGRWDEAEKLGLETIEIQKAKLGADHPDMLTSMGYLAWTYGKQGRYDKSEKLLLEVIETQKAKLGADHPDILTSMGNLALTYGEQGRWDEAEELELKVIEASRAKRGADHPSTLRALSRLSGTFCRQGRLSEAEALEAEVMDMRKEKLGAGHIDTLWSMNNLAQIWHDQGRRNEALTLMQNSVDLLRQKLGHNHPVTQSSVQALEAWQEKS